ncbi:hypothetical protein FUAX_09370 [Fulvitalea axinellae]|uniref:PKD domain-containing protein n=1 Tax=Fulvitalea axinellae TaxID=1182444 RepID=A0AAU9D8C7_9BACT|nr:hypothetical protein FUAX_09370 [Fulvitalea axinellae]
MKRHFTLKRSLLMAVLFVVVVGFGSRLRAQNAYPKIKTVSFRSNDADFIANWSPGSLEHEKYMISRVPLADRFKFSASQANPSIPHARQMGVWAGTSDKIRQSEEFDQPNPYFWQYLNFWAYWNGGDTRVYIPSASYIEAGHRNGVKVLGGCTFADPTSPNNSTFREMIAKNSDESYKHARKLVEIAEHYGFDGYAFNIEVTGYPSDVARQTRGFFQEVSRIADENGLDNFELTYYYVHYDNGNRNFWIKQIDSSNDTWLEENGKTTFSQAFLNYEWNASSLNTSANFVRNNFPAGKNDPYERVFAGLNMPSVIADNNTHPWRDLLNSPTSIAMWLTGPRNNGATPEEKKDIYYAFINDMWSGPDVDPSRPGSPLSGSGKTLRVAGMAAYLAAKSTIDEFPFVTSFNEGCGTFFAKDGERQTEGYWSNLALQDIVPTWRWWWAEGGQNVKASIDFKEAYDGGSSLLLEGNPGSSDNVLRIFKTKLNISAASQVSVTYKVDGASAGDASGLEVALVFENGNGLGATVKLPLGQVENEGWNTKTLDLSAYAGSALAVLGLNVTGVSNYRAHIGGLSLTDTPVATPDAPTSVEASVAMTGRFLSGEITWDLLGSPRYNKDAGVAYFDVYQISDQPRDSVFVGRSLSRAIVLKNVKRTEGEGDMRFRVVAVGEDRKTTSLSESGSVAYDPTPWAEFDMNVKVNLDESLFASSVADYANTYAWTFEDGTPATSASQTPGNVTFATPGVKKVTLTVSNDNGSYTIETDVTVADQSVNLALNQPSYRSSVDDHGGPERGNDGKNSTMFCGRDSYKTPNQQPWWEVDLGSQVNVSQIKAFKRFKESEAGISDFHVMVSKTPFTSRVREEAEADPNVVYNYWEKGQMQAPSVYDLSSQNIVGRYVRVQYHVNRSTKSQLVQLKFGELEVYGRYVPEDNGPKPLTATLSLDDADLRQGKTALLTVTFSEAVTGFEAGDLSFSNGTLSALTGDGTVYNAVFTPTDNIQELENVITLDLAGVQNAEGEAGIGTAVSPNFVINTLPFTGPETLNLSALADAYTYGKNQGTNYGTESTVLVKEGGSIHYVRRAYLKFDLGQIPSGATIESATLKLGVASSNSSALSTAFEIRRVTNDSWTETGITWGNMPAPSDVLASVNGQAAGSVLSVDLTNSLTDDLADGTLSLEMRSSVKGSPFLKLYTKEHTDADLRPVLEVTYTGGVQQRVSGTEAVKSHVPVSETKLFPNPVEDVLNIQSTDEILTVEVFSVQGNLLKTVKGSGASTSVNMSDLPKGVYVVSVTVAGQGVELRRVMKK